MDAKKLLEGIHTDMGRHPLKVEWNEYPNPSLMQLSECFPRKIQNIAQHFAEIKGYPLEYLYTGILTALGLAIGNTHTLYTEDGYTAKSNIFAMIIGERGVNKSEALKDAFLPISNHQEKLYKEYLDKVREWKSLDKSDKENTLQPKFAKPILSDITVEGVASQLYSYPKGCCIVSDELASFVNSFQRYSKSSDEPFYLSAWSGVPITKDRATQESLFIKKPFLSVIGTIQPSITDTLFNGKQESGFFDRWLICFVNNAKVPKISLKKIESTYLIEYDAIINHLLSYELYEESNSIYYSQEAWKVIEEWTNRYSDSMNSCEDEIEKGIRAKLKIYVHRFCLILQLASYCCEESLTDNHIEVDTALKSIKLADYFYDQAAKKRLSEKSDLLNGKYKELYDALPDPIDYEEGFTTKMYLDFAIDFCGISERSAKRFLADNTEKGKKLFIKKGHGKYSKSF